VLAQRFVDGLRSGRRLDPLPDEGLDIVDSSSGEPDPDQPRFVCLVQQALATAMAALEPRDRLRLGLYYAQELTLAQTGRLLGEHEATVSRHLARTRRMIRDFVEEELSEAGLTPEQIDRSFELAMEDAGELDLSRMVAERKDPALDRST
jgi:DNA-directed RNA polymerase specialized sigma24 family protein